MIFPEYKLMFFHSGKTAGTAIEKMILPNVVHMPYDEFNPYYFYGGNGEVLTQHASAHYMYRKLTAEVWDSYFKFTVVRNPYTRLLSVYHYTHDQHKERFGSFKNFILALPEINKQENEWEHLWKGSHYLPQYRYAFVNGDRVVDAIIRFEQLEKDVEWLRERFEIPRPFEKYNTYTNPDRPKAPAISLYSPLMREAMYEVYQLDFQFFNYPTGIDDV